MLGVVFISDYLFDTLSQAHNAMDYRNLRQSYLFVVFGIYFGWFWAKGQTLAMKTWHIRLVDAHGAPVSQVRAFVRYCLTWVWFLPPLVALSFTSPSGIESIAAATVWVAIWALLSRAHPQRQFWHDQLAGTRLVATPQIPR